MRNTILTICVLGTLAGPGAVAGILPQDSAAQYELAFWNSIKGSTHPEDYESYLQAYPKGRFVPLAQGRLERLRAAALASRAELPPAVVPPPSSGPAPRLPRKKLRPAPSPVRPAPAAVPLTVPDALPPVAILRPPETPVPPQAKEARDCPTCPAVVELPGGLFTMGREGGDAPEKPAHSVALGNRFAIGKQEVTFEEWEACADAGACSSITDGMTARDADPVRNVNWEDAQQYVRWLSRTTGKPYRLPTEAEWEYAARGGTADVGPFADNPFGLQDMTGSVWEWVSDCWHGSYLGAPPDGGAWDEPNCQMRVIRGGARPDGVPYVMPSTRWRDFPSVRAPQNGFRVVRDMQ